MPARTGLQRGIALVDAFCKLYAVWQPSMFAAIDASTVGTTAEKAAAKEALMAVMSACTALGIFRRIYES